MSTFKRALNNNEILAALAEWLHRRGHKTDLDAGFTLQYVPPVHGETAYIAITVTVTDVPPDPYVAYNTTPAQEKP